MTIDFEAEKNTQKSEPVHSDVLPDVHSGVHSVAELESSAGENADAPYTVEVAEAAALLGVSRTRLSQLTSKGVFSFERRKIETRNRLFYSKDELLRYMRGQQVRGAGASGDLSNIRWNATRAGQIHAQLQSQSQPQFQFASQSESNPALSVNLALTQLEELRIPTHRQFDTFRLENGIAPIAKSVSRLSSKKQSAPRFPSAQSLSALDSQANNWFHISTQVQEVLQQLEQFKAELISFHLDFSEVKKNLRQALLATVRVQTNLSALKPEATLPSNPEPQARSQARSLVQTRRGFKKRSAQSTAKAKLFK